MTNCPNCNAPIEPYKCKCEYCGTYYFDFTSFDMSGDKPYYVKFKANMNGQDVIVTALARPILEAINTSIDTDDVYCVGGQVMKFYRSRNCDLNVRFQCYEDNENKTLYQVELIEEDE